MLDKQDVVSKLPSLINQGLSAPQIAKIFNCSYPTITKWAREIGLESALKNNGKDRQRKSLLKDGRASYRKYKKDSCEDCGSTESLECHHKIPVVYSKDYKTIISGDHSRENIKTVCNSCHQKIHYRELNRKPVVSDGRTFYAKNS